MAKTERIHLTRRDHVTLQRLCQLGYLRLDQIATLMNTSYKYASKRLIQLRDMGFIQFVWRQDYSGSRVYIPKFKNLDPEISATQDCEAMMKHKPWFNKNFEHEDTLRDWALKVLELNFSDKITLDFALSEKDWISYGEDAGDRKKLPDFVIDCEKSKLAFEIELNPKSTKNYYKILNLIIRREKTGVVYLCKTDAIKTKIEACLERVIVNNSSQSNLLKANIVIRTFKDVSEPNQFQDVIQLATSRFDCEYLKPQEWRKPNDLPSDMKSNLIEGRSPTGDYAKSTKMAD